MHFTLYYLIWLAFRDFTGRLSSQVPHHATVPSIYTYELREVSITPSMYSLHWSEVEKYKASADSYSFLALGKKPWLLPTWFILHQVPPQVHLPQIAMIGIYSLRPKKSVVLEFQTSYLTICLIINIIYFVMTYFIIRYTLIIIYLFYNLHKIFE
jgi:hypothetical protein